MKSKLVWVSALCGALALQGCATTGAGYAFGPSRQAGDQGRPAPWIKETPAVTLTYTAGSCQSEVAGLIPEPVSLFLLTVLFNAVRTDLQRRATARADEHTVTYAARRNFLAAPDTSQEACIRMERLGPLPEDGSGRPVRMNMAFSVQPYGGAGQTQAMVITPHSVLINEPASRANGRDGKRIVNLAVTLAFSGVVAGEDGPEARALASQSFVFADVEEDRILTGDALGDASPVLVRLPAGVPITVAASVTEKGLGGQFYTDVAAALEASKDAGEALISAFYGSD